jgi:hypothetical protein
VTNLQTPAANRRHTCRMRNTWRWLAASCWLFLCSLAWPATQLPVNKLADNIRFKHIMGSADGEISFSGINSMVQDSRGFMWFGGENGLIRYDGKNAVVYQHDPSNPRSLSNGFVFSLLIDHQNYLWVATDAGLNRYNSVSDDFDLFEHDPNNPNSLVNNRIHSIIETRDHSIYVATFGGLNIISPCLLYTSDAADDM